MLPLLAAASVTVAAPATQVDHFPGFTYVNAATDGTLYFLKPLFKRDGFVFARVGEVGPDTNWEPDQYSFNVNCKTMQTMEAGKTTTIKKGWVNHTWAKFLCK